MTRILTIDQGNSSAKAVMWNGFEPEKSLRLFNVAIEEILPLLEEGEADGCVYCSVGHNDAKFLETLRRLVDGRLLVLTASTQLPIKVCYGSRHTLGNDRVAAAAGAHLLFPGEGVLVVDAGTAVTIDVLDSKGTFRGGNIAPGMRLRFESLHNFTSRLPLVDAEGEVEDFGTDTVSAIRSGVIGGMASEIADAFGRSDAYGCSRILLTGNDAPAIMPLLEKRGFPVAHEPDLVGIGLLSVYLYNSCQHPSDNSVV